MLIESLALLASMLTTQVGSENPSLATIPQESRPILELINHARAEAGASALQWDAALAEAAYQHCRRMAAEDSIEKQHDGEPTLTERAGHAGAHFSLIAESVAADSDPSAIYDGWMGSPDDRNNLMSPQLDHIGVAVIASAGVLYAVADLDHAVRILTQTQVEAAIADLLRRSGIRVLRDASAARAACATDRELSRADTGRHPGFVSRWQDPDMTHLPPVLAKLINTPQYSEAEVGSCPAQDVKGAFTTYRVAVLLY